MKRFMTPRAGRPGQHVGDGGLAVRVGKRGPMQRRRVGLRTLQIGGADLHGGGAERKGRGDGAAVGNAASGDHRDVGKFADAAHQGKGSDLGRHVGLEKHAAMTPGFGALRNDDVDAPVEEMLGLAERRRRADDGAADLLHAREQRRRRQAEVEAHDVGAEILDDLASLLAEGRMAGGKRQRRRCDAELCEVRRKMLKPRAILVRIVGRLLVAEEVEMDGLSRLRSERGDVVADLVGIERCARQRSEAARLRHLDRHLDAGGVGHGRLDDRQLDAEQIEQAGIGPGHGASLPMRAADDARSDEAALV